MSYITWNQTEKKPSTSIFSITTHREKFWRIKFIPILTRLLRVSIRQQTITAILNVIYSADTTLNYPGLRSLEGASITISVGVAAICKPFAGNAGLCVFAA
jgi:hypothetical protein